MNKDFDLNLKADKNPSEGPAPRITSVAYCTPGCITGELCGSSECGLTRNCTGSILCAQLSGYKNINSMHLEIFLNAYCL